VACDLTESLLHGYLDGELDAARASEFENHLSSCEECAAELETQEFLRTSMQDALLYERTPTALRTKILSNVAVRERPAFRFQLWKWAAVAACLLILMYAGWRALTLSVGRDQNTELAAQLIDDHIRSLQPGHLSDVVSTDQHTVKPWFDGKLDFAPPVRDFSQQGFPLLGGRLDVLNGRSIAALVYGRRKHFINIFVWPDSGGPPDVRSGSQQGYNWIRWRNGAFELWAVSDVNSSDLQTLQQLFASP